MPNYLLDVNVLIAHSILEHEHHQEVTKGLMKLEEQGARYHVCPIIELGLVRNIMRIASLSLAEAKQLLENERINLDLVMIHDTVSVSELPKWVQGYRQTTDAYLSQLAESHGLQLLTIDKGIPGARRLLR